MPSTRESRKRKTVDRSNDFVDASFSESDDLPLKRLPNPPSLMTTQNSRGKQGGRGRGRGRGRGNGRGNGTESGRAKGGQLDEATTGIHASQSVSNPTPIGTNDGK